MSDSDSQEDKKADKPLSAVQQLRNLVNRLLDEEGCPREDRMTATERAKWEDMRKALEESRVDEAQATAFMERLRGKLAEPERKKRMTKKEIQGYRDRINKIIDEHKARESRLDWEAGAELEWSEKTKKKKPPGSGYVM